MRLFASDVLASARAAARWAALRSDPTYVFNRLACLSNAQPALLSEEFAAGPADNHIYPREECVRWELSALPQREASQHPIQKGLWALPGALSESSCAQIVAEVASLTSNDQVQGAEGVAVQASAVAPLPLIAPVAAMAWAWFKYGTGRWMLPLQPSLGVCESFARGPLSTLRSHNSTDARRWPRLSSSVGGDALRALEALPSECMPSAFSERASLFLQVQRLQRGASIGAHVDEHDVGGRAIMTAVVSGGGGDVRVGGVTFTVRAGDVYALVSEARDDVDHEVYSSACSADRLSVTVRYGGRGEDDPYPFPAQSSTSQTKPDEATEL